jgi:hypothetical protein
MSEFGLPDAATPELPDAYLQRTVSDTALADNDKLASDMLHPVRCAPGARGQGDLRCRAHAPSSGVESERWRREAARRGADPPIFSLDEPSHMSPG